MPAKKFQELTEIKAAEVDKIFRRAFPDPNAGRFESEKCSEEQSTNPDPQPDVARPDIGENAQKVFDFNKDLVSKWESITSRRNELAGVAARVREATSNLQINDAMLGFPPPSRFNSQLPLLVKDLERLGLKSPAKE